MGQKAVPITKSNCLKSQITNPPPADQITIFKVETDHRK